MKRYRRLRRLQPDGELLRRRAAGETFRELAPDYGVSHTTLSRYCVRPDVARQLKQGEQRLRAERRLAEPRSRAEQKAESEARRRAERQQAPEAGSAAPRARAGPERAWVKRHRGLRRLTPDAELFRRRAAGAAVRELAPDYGVSHTTLSRFFARSEARQELRQAKQLQRAERLATDARLRARQKAEREARRRAEQRSVAVSESLRRVEHSASTGSRYVPPLELEPFSAEWLAWYGARRLRSEIDMLSHNDALRGRVPPSERRARERGRRGSVG